MSAGWQILLALLGILVSAAGLVFSIGAWRKAGEAARAADEARGAVRQDNAAEDLRGLAGFAKELLGHAQGGEFDAVLVRSRDLLAGIHQSRKRWARYLGDQGGQRMGSAAKKVEAVSVALSRPGLPPSPDEVNKVVEFCHAVVRTLSEESGRVAEQIEGRGR